MKAAPSPFYTLFGKESGSVNGVSICFLHPQPDPHLQCKAQGQPLYSSGYFFCRPDHILALALAPYTIPAAIRPADTISITAITGRAAMETIYFVILYFIIIKDTACKY